MLNFRFAATAIALLAVSGSANAGTTISNNLSNCSAGKGPAVMITVTGIEGASGKMRVQSYPATKQSWLKKGAWLHRIETKATGSTMRFCVPVPSAGNYAIAIRHDKNGNGKTDIREDGGGMSNNPSINIFNLGKPSVSKTSFYAGSGITQLSISMKYF
ncbi:DUF2141 domain-containing protein [Sphingorhabdus arenilitoris]|uniref:DUF2141 domain-containing protein n=1 Tax=Sphingorhabdus arenilitoris TaxID=1490041 RepID=A0ABV8RLL2_9SPHN